MDRLIVGLCCALGLTLLAACGKSLPAVAGGGPTLRLTRQPSKHVTDLPAWEKFAGYKEPLDGHSRTGCQRVKRAPHQVRTAV